MSATFSTVSIDSYLYSIGIVDTTLPFRELRRRSLINNAAQAADDAPDFSQAHSRGRAFAATLMLSQNEPA